MLGIVKEINGQKTIIPLTTDTGTGAAVGSLLQQYKKKPISGYLYCDGSTFDQNVYPALYMYLGTNVLPDYRECVMVGAEQNTTDTIATHDVYGEGEFKDDQLQRIVGSTDDNLGVWSTGSQTSDNSPLRVGSKTSYQYPSMLSSQSMGINTTLAFDSSRCTRSGDTTHGKQKAVYVYIKATSGLAENQQDNVLKDVKDYVDNSNSYSTQEVKTGGTWIDGKPIYRKCYTEWSIYTKSISANLSNANVDKFVSMKGIVQGDGFVYDLNSYNSSSIFVYVKYDSSNDTFVNEIGSGYPASGSYITLYVEYTKTTD